MIRIGDPEILNALINEPETRKAFGYEELGELDTAPMLADSRNVCLHAAGVTAWFTWRGPGVFEAHVLSSRDGRGRAMFDAARAMIATMQAQFGAKLIWCEIDAARRDVSVFARASGFRSLGLHSPAGRLIETLVVGGV
jgi:hypothetical protein